MEKPNYEIDLYRIPLTNIINLKDYADSRKFLECSQCKYLSILPAYCETCQNSFCKKCIEELGLSDTKCPNCLPKTDSELRFSNDKFYEFFKNLQVRCNKCSQVIFYPDLFKHVCLLDHTIKKIEEKKEDPSETYKLIEGLIHQRCEKCREYIPVNMFNFHGPNCKGVRTSIISPTNISVNPPPALCPYCFKSIEENNQISHLSQCSEFIKKISPSLTGDQQLVQKDLVIRGNILDTFENLNKFTKNLDTSNIQLLIATINNLEKTISEFNKNTSASFCRKCKKVLKNYQLNFCRCCNKLYCDECSTPCTDCEGIISKNCLFTCQTCKVSKCPLCSIQTGNFCLCLEHKICKNCFNDPNVSNIQIAMLKGPHVNCNYVKLLENNIYVVKFPKFNYKAEVILNSIKQPISISLLKNGNEMFSRIFQIHVNDKIQFLSDGLQLKIGSSIDYWTVDLKNIEGGLDYMIINFNTNPNYLYVLNKFNSTTFDKLSPTSSAGVGMLGMFSVGKQLISHILFQKL